MTVGCVLMASGLSRRFGKNKLLEEAQGVSLYKRALDALSPGLFARAAVVSQYGEILAAGERAGFLPVFNPDAGEGISTSIRLGLLQMEETDGTLFSVCDQPWLTRESVARLVAAFCAQPGRIAALAWKGARGNPVIFPRTRYPALLALRGDAGGGAVIAACGEPPLLVEAGLERELRDVDTPRAL